MSRLPAKLRSWFLYTPLYAACTVGYGLVSMAWSRFDAAGARQHRVAQSWARMLLRIAGLKVTVTGLENLPRDQPSVLVCNHLSYMDVPVLFAVLPLQFRILARKGLFSIPFLGGHLRRCQHLPVDQSSARSSMRSLYQAADSVAAGLPVFIFPEAGRSFDGHPRPFVAGAFYLAIQAQAQVVPMVLAGTWEALTPGSSVLRPGRVSLTICPPISAAGLTRHDAPRLAQEVHDLMERLYVEARGVASAPVGIRS